MPQIWSTRAVVSTIRVWIATAGAILGHAPPSLLVSTAVFRDISESFGKYPGSNTRQYMKDI